MRCDRCGRYMRESGRRDWIFGPMVVWRCGCGGEAWTPAGETVTANPAQTKRKLPIEAPHD